MSSENIIAVVDVATRTIIKRLTITAQDPRAITVHNDRLYILPFESNNQTQLSGGTGPFDGNLTTFDARKHVIDNNNVLSLGAVLDIVKHPRVPDRDLYVFDTTTDELIEVVNTVGTLCWSSMTAQTWPTITSVRGWTSSPTIVSSSTSTSPGAERQDGPLSSISNHCHQRPQTRAWPWQHRTQSRYPLMIQPWS